MKRSAASGRPDSAEGFQARFGAVAVPNPDDRRLSGPSFENCLTLVLESGSGEWSRTMQFYSVRIQIAHGTLLSERIDVSGEVQELFGIQASWIWSRSQRFPCLGACGWRHVRRRTPSLGQIHGGQR